MFFVASRVFYAIGETRRLRKCFRTRKNIYMMVGMVFCTVSVEFLEPSPNELEEEGAAYSAQRLQYRPNRNIVGSNLIECSSFFSFNRLSRVS